MLLHPPTGSARRAWWAVAGWVAALYVGVFFARDVQEFVARTLGRDAFTAAAGLVVLAGLVALVRWLRRHRPSVRFYTAAALTAALYLGGIWHLRRAPEEAMHLIEYGGLSLLVFRALGFSLRDPLIHVAAALFCGLVGTGDEILQWLAPRRSFDFRDIAINVLSGLGLQLLLGLVLRPAWTRGPVSARSRAVVGGLAGLWALLFLFCLNNTLERQTRWLARLDFLPASIRTMNDTMVEYGHLHRDPAFGAFYSRLPLDELHRQDRERTAEAAARLRASREPGGHDRFAAVVTGVTDPFLYEIYIHLFRRNRYARDAADTNNSPAHLRFAATVAYRENQVLERHFAHTLAASGETLKPNYVAAVERLADRVTPHTSAVSEQLIVRFTAAQATAVLGGLAIAAWAWALYHGRRTRAPREPDPPPVSRP